jgi:hypothetical protein
MIIINCEQGTPEWHAARAGVITASTFSEALEITGGLDAKQQAFVDAVRAGKSESEALLASGYKKRPTAEGVERAIAGEVVGVPSPGSERLAATLAIERITGQPYGDTFETFALRRGKEQEQFARMRYEERFSVIVDEQGVILTDDRLFGASVDGLVEIVGGMECKVPVDLNKVLAILRTGDLSEYKHQIQGCMWITGRKWWDFIMGVPDLAVLNNGNDLYVQRVYRDDNFIEEMELGLLKFAGRVKQLENFFRSPYPNNQMAAPAVLKAA